MAPPRKFIKSSNCTTEGNKLISFFDDCWFKLSFVNKNWQQILLDQIDIILCTVKTKNWQRVTIALKVLLQVS